MPKNYVGDKKMADDSLIQILIILIPVLVVQVIIQVFSLWHLWKRSATDKKTLFALLIICFNFIGIAAYWLAGSEGYKPLSNDIDKGEF